MQTVGITWRDKKRDIPLRSHGTFVTAPTAGSWPSSLEGNNPPSSPQLPDILRSPPPPPRQAQQGNPERLPAILRPQAAPDPSLPDRTLKLGPAEIHPTASQPHERSHDPHPVL